MKQKFIVKHLASWSPLVQKLLSRIVLHTTNSNILVPDWIECVVNDYVSALPKGLYEYEIKQDLNEWWLYEDGELVLRLALIEIYELAEHDPH